MDQKLVGKRPRGEDKSGCNATIVAETISCWIARNGKRSKRSSVLPREIKNPAPFAHTDGSLRWSLGQVEDREGGDRGMSKQDIDDRGDSRVRTRMWEASELQVKLLQGNAVLPEWGSARAVAMTLYSQQLCNTLTG